MKILFSIPAHENNDVLCDVIENIQKFIEEPIIVIHANQSFGDFDPSRYTKYQNVHVNPERLPLVKYQSMLPILISNFKFSEQFDYEYIYTFHTNELFYKKGFEKFISNYDMSMEWIMQGIGERCELLFKTKIEPKVNKQIILNNHVEGTFYKKELFKSIVEYIENEIPEVINSVHAMEETVLPMVAYHLFANKDKIFYKSTLLHTEQRQISIDELNILLTDDIGIEMFYGIKSNTNDIFSIKPVHRTMDNELRSHIRNL